MTVSNKNYFGFNNATADKEWMTVYNKSPNFYCGTTGGKSCMNSSITKELHDITITIDGKTKSYVAEDGDDIVTTSSYTGSFINNPGNYMLFTVGGNLTTSRMGSFKMGEHIIYQDNILVRHFIPCINSSNEVGMYDTVTDKFYANKGTGSFIAGPVDNSAKQYVHLWGNGSSIQVLGSDGSISTIAGLVKQYDILNAYGGSVDNAMKACIDVAVSGADELTVSFKKTVNVGGSDVVNDIMNIVKSLKYQTTKVENFVGFASSEITSGTITNGNTKLKLKYNFADAYSLKLDYVLQDGSTGSLIIPLTTAACKDDNTYSISSDGKDIIKGGKALSRYTSTNKYTLLTYIQSSGSQYIDTGFKATSENLKIVTEMSAMTVSYKNYFGFNNATADTEWMTVYNKSPNFYCGTTGGKSCMNSSITKELHDITITIDGKTKTYIAEDGGNAVTTSSYTGSFINNPGNYMLFTVGGNLTTSRMGTFKMGKHFIYQDGTLVRAFYPAKDSSDKVGMYDTVTKKFYYNSGTGSFTAGNVVEYKFLNIYNGYGLYSDGTVVDLSTLSPAP